MKRIKIGCRWLKDILGVTTLMMIGSLATLCYVNPEYVGFKAWCIGEAYEQVFLFEEPTDEQLVVIAEIKLRILLWEYCVHHDLKTHPYDLDVEILQHYVWGHAHRNVKFEYKWFNPVTKEYETNIKNIRVIFNYIGEFIDPYPHSFEEKVRKEMSNAIH